ncbi:EF-hand domain-containing protein [Thiospirillum jenense]|nr:EF-hand domain-containing protein [Thiospirillum jenense]
MQNRQLRQLTTTIAVGGLLFMTLSSDAQPPFGAAGGGAGMGRMMMPAFSTFDANGDGQLTRDEFEQARAARIAERSQQGYQMRGLANAPGFDQFDQNKDGQVTAAEFAAIQSQHRGAGPAVPSPIQK